MTLWPVLHHNNVTMFGNNKYVCLCQKWFFFFLHFSHGAQTTHSSLRETVYEYKTFFIIGLAVCVCTMEFGFEAQQWEGTWCNKMHPLVPSSAPAWRFRQEASWIIRDVLMHGCCNNDDVDALFFFSVFALGIGGITCNPLQINSQANKKSGNKRSSHQVKSTFSISSQAVTNL